MLNLPNLTANVITGGIATVVILMGVRGLFPHLMQPTRREAFHLAMAFILCMVGGVGRTIYWDLSRLALGAERWIIVRDQFGGVEANVAFNLVLLWGGLHLLKLLHLLVPLFERDQYSMWTAWNHPIHLGRALGALRLFKRKGKK